MRTNTNMTQPRKRKLDTLNFLHLRMSSLLKEMDNVGFINEDLGESFFALQKEFKRFSEKVMENVYLGKY